MNAYRHIGWFDLAGRESLQLQYGSRTQYIIREMTHPDTQYPSLMLFLGSRSKDAALRELYPNNNLRRGYRNGIVNLRLDSATISAELPILFADGNSQHTVPHRLGMTQCHEQTTISLAWRTDDALLRLYARLVAPFTDVICIFADDFDGLENVASFLVRWVKVEDPSTLPQAIRPRVVIVTREEENGATYNILELEDFRHVFDQGDARIRAEIFSDVWIMHLAGDHVSPLARHRRLKEVLMGEVEKARCRRLEHRVLFSAVHFNAFFRHAIDHVAASITEPFDFIASSRLSNDLTDDYRDHVRNFISLGKDFFVSYKSLTSFLASSILMDAYPPRIYSKSLVHYPRLADSLLVEFEPSAVFHRLYRPHYISALTAVLNSPMFAEDICQCVEDSINVFFSTIDLGFKISVEVHANNLKQDFLQWTQFKSHRTCLFCLRRKPEHILTCEHAMCDVCMVLFGDPILGKEHHFRIDACLLCTTKGRLLARIKPQTAGARILTVDGGGVRGVVPLEFLGLLQGLLGTDLTLQDLFDQAFGTSSGTRHIPSIQASS